MKRFLITILVIGLVLFGAANVALWVFLRSWLPTTGKEKLIAAIEEKYPVRVTIGQLAYNPWHGAVLSNVEVRRAEDSQRLASGSRITATMRWMPFLLNRDVAFRSQLRLEAPCPTEVRVDGQYRLKTGALDAHAVSQPFFLSECDVLVRAPVPPPVLDGRFRLDVRTHLDRESRPTLVGRIEAQGLRVERSPVKSEFDAVLEGQALPPGSEADTWKYDAMLVVRSGRVQGLPRIGEVNGLNARARLLPETITIESLEGTVLGSPVRAQGTVQLIPSLLLDFGADSRVDLAGLTTLFSGQSQPGETREWELQGSAEMHASCRASQQTLANPDCQAQAVVREAAVAGKKLPYPITHGMGTIQYDHFTRRVTLSSLSGRMNDQPFVVEGTVDLLQPISVMLGVTGEADLANVKPWLPADGSIRDLSGQAKLDLLVQGPVTKLRPTGRVDLNNARAFVAALGAPVEEIDASVLLNEDDIQVNDLACTYRGLMVTGDGSWKPGQMQHIEAMLQIPRGGLNLRGRISESDFWLDQTQLWIDKNRVAATGRVSRSKAASELSLEGELQLEQLASLPLYPITQAEAWGMKGPVNFQARYTGPLSDWTYASIAATVKSPSLIVRDVPLEGTTLQINQDRDTLRGQLQSQSLAGGPTSLEFSLQHLGQESKFTVRGQILELQLAKLRQAVPKWRDRDVSGDATLQATLYGVWQRRATWAGEGLIRAKGQNLADIPLLEKLFRGLFGTITSIVSAVGGGSLESLRRAEVRSLDATWRLADERIATNDLRLGAVAAQAPVSIYATGSVGLDGTLDFTVEPDLTESLLEGGQSGTATAALKAAGEFDKFRRLFAKLRMTGTIQEPKFERQFAPGELIKSLVPSGGDVLQGVFDSIFGPSQ